MVVWLFLATPLVAQPLPEPGNSPVSIHDAAGLAQIAGRGVTAGSAMSAPAFDRNGNELVWREVRSGTDALGARHVFYRQYLVHGGLETELFGSEVGVHYTKTAELRAVLGHQFRDVVIANRPLLKAAAAVERAVARLQKHPSFRAERSVNASDRAYREKHAQLKLVQVDGNFRYTWFTLARNDEGVEHNVAIDAQTEAILSVTDLHKGSNCHPTGPWSYVSAVGHPVRPDLRNAGVRRTIRANVTNDRPSPFTREGFWNGTPNISVTQETATTAFFCFTGVARSYTLFPVGTDSGVATYRDRGDEWRGYAAGDVLHNSRETMLAFTTLGRNGWDGNNGDSNVVLESTFLGSNLFDFAYFRMTGNGDSRVPITPFMGIGPTRDFYNPGASIDHIAHEWGHGVVFTSANFPETTLGLQMHEGWADVIGQSVEKLRQPSGTGVERSGDWTMHEDGALGGYARGALDDGTVGHTWTRLDGTLRSFNDTVHRQDEPAITQAHARGNMLSMVLRLMSDGGGNPICSRQPSYAGCGTSSGSLGSAKAAQILFDTLTWYTPSTARWEDLAEYATYAAFDRYNQCDYLPTRYAVSEQNAVNAAFTAIGYPRLVPTVTCP